MPRHLISDAHEWTNKIIAVSNNFFSEITAKGTVLAKTTGKEVPVELDFIFLIFCL